MDRLVCGDVGYGKTEVAHARRLRGRHGRRQVAVLVPTTVLAQQHFDTLRQRFEGYPVRGRDAVALPLQRREQAATIARPRRTATVDIVVGTHRLLQNDVEFKSLGLLVIDEEHRFGVKHKERIKQLRKLVDVLTLTATPIPRTLQMALIGIRDLSRHRDPAGRPPGDPHLRHHATTTT